MPRPWALAIEVSNPSSAPTQGQRELGAPGVAAAWLDASEPAQVERLRGAGRHDDDLMPAIERLRAAIGASPRGLSRLVISTGPGGYTGLRVAVTTAKMLAEVTGATIIAVPSAAVVAAALADQRGGGAFPALVCLASKRGTAHVTRFADHADHGTDLGVLSADDLPLGTASAIRTLAGDAFIPDAMAARAAEAGAAVIWPGLEVGHLLKLGMTSSPGCWEVSAADLIPQYPREPEAVRVWRERHPPGSSGPIRV